MPLDWLRTRPWKQAVLAGLGGFLAIGILALLGDFSQLQLLIPPFGASCVLAFGFPASPFAQPKNIIGGHVIAALSGLIACWLFGLGVLGVATGVGLAIAAMMVTDTVHPPAGANPVVVAMLNPGIWFLVVPVLLGATIIVLLSAAYNRGRAEAKI